MTIRLSIIVAVYSETSSVRKTIKRLLNKDRGYIHEIILVVSPQSSEACFEVCNKLVSEYNLIIIHIQIRNPGLGWAFREGMELATGTHIVIMSADLETEPEAVDRMVRKAEETNCDVVVGNRWMRGGKFYNYDPLKLILSRFFQFIFSSMYQTQIEDLSYGFKLMRKEVVDNVPWEGTLHEICIETTLKPLKMGYRFEQVPTVWVARKEGQSRNTFLRNFRYVRSALSIHSNVKNIGGN